MVLLGKRAATAQKCLAEECLGPQRAFSMKKKSDFSREQAESGHLSLDDA